MAIIKRSLGNNRSIIAQEFRKIRNDGLGGLAFSMFCAGWKLAWRECLEQNPKRGKKNSCSIEFIDNGQKEIVSRNALRKDK